MFGVQRSDRNPGRFNCSLTLEPSSEAQSTAGDHQPGWDTAQPIAVHGRWMPSKSIIGQSGMAQTKFDESEGRWEIPWVPELTSDYRVTFGVRLYRIIGIENLGERNRELHLYCVEDEGAKGV